MSILVGERSYATEVRRGRLFLNGQEVPAILDHDDATIVISDRVAGKTAAAVLEVICQELIAKATAPEGQRINMRGATKPARRRRPGETWRVWRIQGKYLGRPFLVTEGRNARPVARCWTVDEAHRVAAGEAAPPRFGDLRNRRGRNFPKVLLNRLLMPVDRRGRPIRNDSTFAAGYYMAGGLHGTRDDQVVFCLATHAAIEMGFPALHPQNKSGSNRTTHVPQLGGGENGSGVAKRAA